MRIHIHLYAGLERHVKDYRMVEGIELDIDKPISIEEIAARFELPRKEVGIVSVNGKRASLRHRVRDGDRIGLFSYVAGG